MAPNACTGTAVALRVSDAAIRRGIAAGRRPTGGWDAGAEAQAVHPGGEPRLPGRGRRRRSRIAAAVAAGATATGLRHPGLRHAAHHSGRRASGQQDRLDLGQSRSHRRDHARPQLLAGGAVSLDIAGTAGHNHVVDLVPQAVHGHQGRPQGPEGIDIDRRPHAPGDLQPRRPRGPDPLLGEACGTRASLASAVVRRARRPDGGRTSGSRSPRSHPPGCRGASSPSSSACP